MIYIILSTTSGPFLTSALVHVSTRGAVGLQVTKEHQLPQEWAERLQKELQWALAHKKKKKSNNFGKMFVVLLYVFSHHASWKFTH